MAVITLTTDFGLDDEYVGVMKGAILTVNPRVQLVDISHHVPAFDVRAAARMLEAAYPYFPAGSVHMVVVDPGVGSSRPIVAFDMAGHRFIAPDNGIPDDIIQGRTVDAMVRIPVPEASTEKPSDTFHGRDVFAPAAARLAGGCILEELGLKWDASRLVSADHPVHKLENNGTVAARIMSVDRFGNLITDLSYHRLKTLLGDVPDKRVVAHVGRDHVQGVCHHYGQAGVAEAVMVVGSRGYLEIAVNQGSAREYFGVSRDDRIVFSLVKGHGKN